MQQLSPSHQSKLDNRWWAMSDYTTTFGIDSSLMEPRVNNLNQYCACHLHIQHLFFSSQYIKCKHYASNKTLYITNSFKKLKIKNNTLSKKAASLLSGTIVRLNTAQQASDAFLEARTAFKSV